MNNKNNILRILPYILSFVLLGIYLISALHYARIIEPVMDEGTYLLKGKWFLEGTYKPFQEYGPVTNKPPLSFYTLGLSQVMFEPGLQSGRYFAVFLSLLLLIGQWMTVERLAGKWWAAASIALYVISPAWIIYYSRVMTQVVTSLLIVWSLYFFLGEKRSKTQLIIGAALAACTAMIRQNLLPFYAFALLYILWENGLKKSWLPIGASLVTFIFLNAIHWPEIYSVIWAPYFPQFINDFVANLLNIPQTTGDLGSLFYDKQFIQIYEIQVLFDGIRYFFLPIFTTFVAVLAYFRGIRNTKQNKKTTLFLGSVFLVLSGIHYFYAISRNNVLFSFPAYFAFFLPIGVTLIPLVIRDNIRKPTLKFGSLASLTIIFSTGIGLSLYREIAPFFMDWRLPSLSQRTFSGSYQLWDVLLNRFGITIRTQEFILPTIAGFLAGLLIIGIAHTIHHVQRKKEKKYSYTSILLITVFSLGVILSPTFILAANSSIKTCPGQDIPARYALNGAKMGEIIPAGSKVYWEGYTPIIFLYMPDVDVFPPQLNMKFYYRIGGDTEYLERKNLWNAELALQWIQESAYLVFDQEWYQERFLKLDPELQSQFEMIDNDIILDACNQEAVPIILQRSQDQ